MLETAIVWALVIAMVIAYVYAVVEVLVAERSVSYKLVWIAVILLWPLFGLVVYFATADR